MSHRFTYASIFALSITVTAGACAVDGDDGADNETPPSERLIRSSSAAADAITLSAELSQLAAAPSLAGVTEGDLGGRAGELVGAGCATAAIDQNRVEVSLDCGGVSGTVIITFDDADCLDPVAGCDEVAVSVETELELDDLRIAGRFDNLIAGDTSAAAGELSIEGALFAPLAVAFDLTIASDGACDTIDGTLEVDSGAEVLSVAAARVIDCGGDCADSGVLSASAGDQQVTVDFDAGVASGTDALGNRFETPIDCSL